MAFEGKNKRLSGPINHVGLKMSKKKKSLEGQREGEREERGKERKGKGQVARHSTLEMFENQLGTG